MPNTQSAKKKLKVDRKRTAVNWTRKIKVKDAVKNFKETVLKSVDDAKKLVPNVFKKIDIAAKNNVLHKNKAARMKSKISKQLNETK